MTIKIYCEHGAFRSELLDLQKKGIIEIINFPYEMRTSKEHRLAKPSKLQWRDANIPWNEMNFPWKEMNGSYNFESIRYILDRRKRTRRDALHVDSAYKTKCNAFLSRDQHILVKAQELENLLGIRFFHPDDNWNDLLSFLGVSP